MLTFCTNKVSSYQWTKEVGLSTFQQLKKAAAFLSFTRRSALFPISCWIVIKGRILLIQELLLSPFSSLPSRIWFARNTGSLFFFWCVFWWVEWVLEVLMMIDAYTWPMMSAMLLLLLIIILSLICNICFFGSAVVIHFVVILIVIVIFLISQWGGGEWLCCDNIQNGCVDCIQALVQ